MFKMNDEQIELFEKLTPLQKEVSLNSISGMKDIDAYKASRGKAKTINTMRASVSEILINPNVIAFKKAMAEHIVNPAVMSRQEMMEKLSSLARTNMSDLISWRTATTTGEEGEEVEQSMWTINESAESDPAKMASIAEVSAGKDGFKIKQHSPLTAMKQLAELAGYEAPKQLEVSSKEELTPWGAITASADE